MTTVASERSFRGFFKVVLAIVVYWVAASNGYAQTPKTDRADENSFGRIGVRYANDYVYLGRSDSLAAPYITPSLAYFHKSGFFLQGALSYLPSESESRIDLYTITGGYDYLGDRLSVGASATSYFFNSDSYAVQSTMKAYFNTYVGYDLRALEVYLDGSLGLSENVDFFGGLDLRRTFSIARKKIRITPSLYINAGSQYYYREYYATRNSVATKGSGYGKGGGKNSGQTSGTTTEEVLVRVEDESKFQVLDYEISVGASYKLGNFRLVFSPVYAIPVNPATVTIDETIAFREELDNKFYWSVSLNYLWE